MTMKVTPKTVSGRVVKTGRRAPPRFPALEADLGALAAPDPVGLHQLDRLGPLDVAQPVQQLVGVGGDAEVPGGDLLLGQAAVAAPADAVLGLLVGEGGLAGGAPPLPLGVPVGQALAVQQQEEPLRPAVVLGQRASRSPAPSRRRCRPGRTGACSWPCCGRSPTRGLIPVWMANCSVGSPKASQPMGCSTL